MVPHDDTAIVAIRNILTRLCKRSGLSADRLRTTEIDINPLLDLPAVKRYAEEHSTTRRQAVLPVVREHARRLPPTHRVITDAELSLGLLRESDPGETDLSALYSQDLGARREYLSAHWSRLHRLAAADPIPPLPRFVPSARPPNAGPSQHWPHSWSPGPFTPTTATVASPHEHKQEPSPSSATP